MKENGMYTSAGEGMFSVRETFRTWTYFRQSSHLADNTTKFTRFLRSFRCSWELCTLDSGCRKSFVLPFHAYEDRGRRY